MSLTQFSGSTDIIAALPDTPSSPDYTSQTLKAKFDEAAGNIKTYINSTLIPDIEDEFTNTVLGDGAYHYIPSRVLAASFLSAGTFTFTADASKSFTGIYDIVCVGGGGGGSVSSLTSNSGATGGGAGAVVTLTGQAMTGSYTVTVGAGGSGSYGGTGGNGGDTYVLGTGVMPLLKAGGGKGSSQSNKIGFGGGVGGGDSVYGDGTISYGHGGDNSRGRGVRGAALSDDCGAAEGYGAGGWGQISGKPGEVLIYGYQRMSV